VLLLGLRARWNHDSMYPDPDPGCYEARYRVSRAAQRGLSTSLVLLPTGLGLMNLYLPIALVLVVLGAITALPAVAGLALRRTAFRADYAGITLGADLRDGWTLRWDRGVFVPWAEVEQIVIYPGQGFPAGSRAPRIGIQRRPGAPELSAGDGPAPGCPLPRVTTAATRPVSGWRLDRDRLAAVTAMVAPDVPVVDLAAIDTSPGPASILGPSDPIDTSPGPASILGPADASMFVKEPREDSSTG
jgi:hypothetical protein